jgi:AraC family transcriptional regulator, regulatory protein of adaptative response / methylated-DNA-[protein]-cysteine methyltransferase
MKVQPSPAEMQRAFLRGDAGYDGVFWAGVRTTGIFCRPSCRARKPKVENLEFFPSVKAAMAAGYRPCLRCRPLKTSGRPPEWIAPLLAKIETAEARLSTSDLRALNVDPVRVRRWFVAHLGMTFAAFCRARRLQRAFTQLRAGADLDDVILGNGFESHSGFRAAFGKHFAKPPGRSRAAECITTTMLESPFGPLVAGATDAGVCLLEFTDRRALNEQLESARRRLGLPLAPGTHPHLKQLTEELRRYFAGELRVFGVPLVAPGTPFQELVWSELRRIPYGTTISYAQLAHRVGRPGAQRAVGTANGLNRLCIVIPCHRVVNASGELGGYGGGLWRKRLLLDLERQSSGRAGTSERATEQLLAL